MATQYSWGKRALSALVSLALVVTSVPVCAYAQDDMGYEALDSLEEIVEGEDPSEGDDPAEGEDPDGLGTAQGDNDKPSEPVYPAQTPTEESQAESQIQDEDARKDSESDARKEEDIREVEEALQVEEVSRTEEDPIVTVESDTLEETANASKVLLVTYNGYVQGKGWSGWKRDGTAVGEGILESLRIRLRNAKKQTVPGVMYKAYIQGEGWTDWVSDSATLGRKGSGRRIEAIKVKLSDELSATYDVVYRSNVDSYGWLDWTSNGSPSGSTGKKRGIVSVQVTLQKKGLCTIQLGKKPYYDGAAVVLSAHMETIGWQKKRQGKAGAAGEGLRMEAVTARLNGAVDYSGSIVYSSYVHTHGWMKSVKNGKVSGTTGESKRIEAMSIKLTGQVSKHYDVYYRVYVQSIGWLGWAKNGESAGSEGFSLRAEAIQVKLVHRGSKAPSSSASVLTAPYVSDVSVRYRASEESLLWLKTQKNGSVCGEAGGQGLRKIKVWLSGSSLDGDIVYQTRSIGTSWTMRKENGKAQGRYDASIEAIRVSLTGELAKVFNVYYSVHVAGRGWLAWAKNGAKAGSGGYNAAIDAIKIKLVAKFQAAPSNATADVKKTYFDGQQRLNVIEEYLAFAVDIANDDSHGYSQLNRWGPDYDCSSLVITSLKHAGLPTGTAYYTGDMLENLRENGWLVMRYVSMSQLVRGDILLTPYDHTEFYLGDGKNVRAWMSEHGTIWGTAGDQNGHEIEVVDFHTNGSHGWTYVLRLK